MADNIYLTLKGKSQGNIEGEPTLKSHGRDKTIECIEYELGAHAPFDNLSGMPSGKRQYAPIKIRKRIDMATPLLWHAFAMNESVDGEFKFFRPHKAGDTEMFFSIKFTNGRIVGMKNVVLDTWDAQKKPYPPLDEVTFVFEKIEWTYTQGGKSAADEWSQTSSK